MCVIPKPALLTLHRAQSRTDHEFTVAHGAFQELFIESENVSSLTVAHLTLISYTSGPESCAEYIVKDSLIGQKSVC